MKIFLSLIFIMMSLHAEVLTLELKQGWQLVGVSTTLNVEEAFKESAAQRVWSFDAQTQSWQGYATDPALRAKIEAEYTLLQEVAPYQALWVFSAKDWQLQYEVKTSEQTPSSRSISLKEGWNLVSLPQNIVVSEKLFGDDLVYKYSEAKEWQSNKERLGLPSITAIMQSDGLWVKSSSDRQINIDEAASKLHTFISEDEMLAYIRKMLTMQQYRYNFAYGGVEILADTPEAVNTNLQDSVSDEATADATSTNLQESGVDESDILKHDGTYIYSVNNAQSEVLVTSFSRLAAHLYEPLTRIDLSGEEILSLYLQEDRLVVISRAQYTYEIGKPMPLSASRSTRYSGGESEYKLSFYDVSDINNIRALSQQSISGNYEESRLIDGELFVISKFRPTVRYDYPHIYIQTTCHSTEINSCVIPNTVVTATDASLAPVVEGCNDEWYNECYQYNYDEKGAYTLDYEHPIVIEENLTPMIKNGEERAVSLLDPQHFFAPSRLDQSGAITSVIRFTLSDGKYENSSAFIGDTHTYYASLHTLYLLSEQYPLYYDYIHYKDQQMIYAFSLDENLSYRGKGVVEGRMLNQFSMSEYRDYLRVATSSGWSWWNGGNTNNSIYTLKLEDKHLAIKGQLQGLGHEGERIRGVRFMGERGFVVTFRQSDPLYTIDLSDPLLPSVVGELSIPGYSSYLHIVDENRVLSIGRDADETGRVGALEFQLFDISDFSKPRLADKIQIGDARSYSEAEYNHKALSYRASDTLFGVPYRTYNTDGYKSSEHFGIYQIKEMSIVNRKDIEVEGESWSDNGRGVIFDLNNITYGALLKGKNMVCEPLQGVSP